MFVLNYYVKTTRKQKENGIFNNLGKRHLLRMVTRTITATYYEIP